MALYSAMLPDDVIDDLKKISSNSEEIFGEVTKAGAEVALSNVRSSAPLPEIASHAKLSRSYKTPSDGGSYITGSATNYQNVSDFGSALNTNGANDFIKNAYNSLYANNN